MKILVLNSGSTSQKVALVEASRQSQSNDIATDIVWKNEQSNLKPEQSRFEAIEIDAGVEPLHPDFSLVSAIKALFAVGVATPW